MFITVKIIYKFIAFNFCIHFILFYFFQNNSSSQPNDLNRTMVFLIGRNDVRLISPDTKKILLYIHLKDVTSCIQVFKL